MTLGLVVLDRTLPGARYGLERFLEREEEGEGEKSKEYAEREVKIQSRLDILQLCSKMYNMQSNQS